MNETRYTFTIFTPTYNRRHTLHRVYDSLKQQTFKDFEWLIVDDGSNDDTEGTVKNWQQHATFPITYVFQENAGKHNAINKGVSLAKGALFAIADSDDSFIPDTLQIFYDTWLLIPADEQSKYAGIWAMCMDEKGNIIPDSFPESPWDCTVEQRLYKNKINGEKWHVERIEVMREFPFPSLKIKGFYFPEGIIWSKMNKKYLFRCINQPVRIYHRNETGIMSNTALNPTNTLSMYVSIEAVLNNEIEYFWHAPLLFVEYTMLFIKYTIELNIPLSDSFKKLTPLSSKALFLCFLPLIPVILGISKWRKSHKKG
jgi:glycosyltransferase involved in cell wall biosynthesis